MLTFARGTAVNLDIFMYEYDGGPYVDPDGYAGGTEPTLKIYDHNGTLVHEEIDNSNIVRLAQGHFRFTSYTIEVTAPTGSNWRVVWFFRINGNLLPVATRTEYFAVTTGGAASYTDPYDSKEETAELVEGISVDDIKETWRDWAKLLIDHECGHDFYAHDAGTEVHDINRSDQDTVILRHWPVITLTQLRDNVNGLAGVTATTIASGDYHIYDDGRVRLVSTTYSYFTEGPVNVDIQYTYGYIEVPDVVRMLANFLVAFRAQVWLTEKEAVDGGGALGTRSIRIGDFEETFAQNLTPVEQKFGDAVTGGVQRMMRLVKDKYGYGVV